MISWFDTRASKDFGLAMASFYTERMPPTAGGSEKQFAARSRQTLEKMSQQVVVFKQQNKLNTYKVAQVGNTFKWALKDAGYEDSFVDELTQWLVTVCR